MEDILQQIISNCSSGKLANLKTAAQECYDFLQCQNNFMRDPAYMLREKCFTVFQICFETKKVKLITSAISGFHRMLRDNRFYSNFEPENDSLWLSAQLLQAVSSIGSQSDDTQVEILKVLLIVACSPNWTINGRIIIQLLSLCSEIYGMGTEAVRTASQAAASQTLRAFCHLLDIESLEAKDSKMNEVGSGGIDCFNELIPILQYICSRLDDASNAPDHHLLLECLLTILSSLPQKIHSNQHFTKFIWQKMTPVLIGLMDSPKTQTLSQLVINRINIESFSSKKLLYSIANQLVRIVGCVGSLRPVLESIYHRMLLLALPQQRVESLKALTELFRSPSRLIDFCGPLLVKDKKGLQTNDMALTRLVMLAINESVKSNDMNVISSAVLCIATLLNSLNILITGDILNEFHIKEINNLYPTIESSTYLGPPTYQILQNLSTEYKRDLDDREDDFSCSSSDCSSETDNDFNQVDEDEVNNCVKKSSRDEQEKESFKCSDSERDNAKHFIETLCNQLTMICQTKSVHEIDYIFQQFSSKYCKGEYYNKHDNLETAILNADGIYLAIYSALNLNLKLINQNYYKENSFDLPITENEFVSQVEESGILVYLSSKWLREVYQQILSRDVLSEGKCRDNSSILNLLIDLGGFESSNETLSSCEKLEKISQKNDFNVENISALKLTRRILTCCWDTIILVLKEGVKADRSIMADCLRSLHTAAILCHSTGLQKQSVDVFSLLSTACCTDYGEGLLASQAISLNLMLTHNAVQIASNAPLSWPHILNCCTYINKLEAKYRKPTFVSKNSLNLYGIEEPTIPAINGDIPSLVNGTSDISALPQSIAGSVIFLLSKHIDKLFEDVAVKLKLGALLQFVKSVCSVSEKQLKNPHKICSDFLTPGVNNILDTILPQSITNTIVSVVGFKSDSNKNPTQSLLFVRLSEILIKASRSGRPLIHIMKLWSVIGPHLMNASCHEETSISKFAINSLHDIIAVLLNEISELPHFHFNEALFKPFEIILCLELCDIDIQEQVLNCLCEFVESSEDEIKSGWKPLFKALGAVSTNDHMVSLLEVFKVFLSTENSIIFANAAMDFIQCLVKHVKGNGVSEEASTLQCKEILELVYKTNQVLYSLYLMPSSPSFNTGRRLNERCVELSDSSLDLSGILTVWAELIESLICVVQDCSSTKQSLILEKIFVILYEIMDKPGVDFATYCCIFILFPPIERWAFTNSNDDTSWNYNSAIFKQFCGLVTQYVIKLLEHLNDESEKGTLILKNLTNILSKCIFVPVESISRLGCACLRHVVTMGGEILNEKEWEIFINSLTKSTNQTLSPLRTVMKQYTLKSDSFYGDIGHIKVGAKSDKTVMEIQRMKYIAQQVFLLENQRLNALIMDGDEEEEAKSYLLQLYSNKETTEPNKTLSISSLLICTLAHQILLQTIGLVLLQCTKQIVPSISELIEKKKNISNFGKIPYKSIHELLLCLENSYNFALEYDQRPGLKFLLQKVIGLNNAANLYKQASAAWTIQFVALLDLCITEEEIIERLLEKIHKSLTQLIDIYVNLTLHQNENCSVTKDGSNLLIVNDQINAIPSFLKNHLEGNSEIFSCHNIHHEKDIIKTSEFCSDDVALSIELEQQQKESIIKDKEAQIVVWTEMIISALNLISQIDDTRFKIILPAIYTPIKTLTLYSVHTSLKFALSKISDRMEQFSSIQNINY